jgi:hypothetical protein
VEVKTTLPDRTDIERDGMTKKEKLAAWFEFVYQASRQREGIESVLITNNYS